ncbi:Uncharacterized membrane protein [Faunimonas pinastri]|uniref:Uncharacterized membrane protein n=1 Tax=Faunimonas pinastri TaxID=1855383 RepID=A0A1H9D6M1_9HYPH|nr:TMEM175 family protein [Faunimonas pinastri]SEQ09029.1 Uncharacterized membrane protein [Faunimonas pinastri]
MHSERLKAFTDGVLAVIITIMVLELKPPHGATPEALLELMPVFLSYVLSFIYVAIYWNNHHHFFTLAPKVNGTVLWCNLHLLFWISLIPFTTAWMGEHELQPWPTAVYGFVLLACAVAWALMQASIIRLQGPNSELREATGRDWKGKASPILYLIGIALAFVTPILADVIYAAVAGMWLIPDRRVQTVVQRKHQDD